MSSPISSALAKLDDCLQAVQMQVEYLRSGLEVDDAQLTTALEDACQNAAEVRELIRAERSDANWNNRESLDSLTLELEIAAHERRNQELRTRLLELADELEAGTVKHRSEARTNALNSLRQEAIQELRAEAAIPEQSKELPGPEASEWLHWALNLEESKDADALQSLRTDFVALDQFAGEMEENYWTPGNRVHRSAPPTPPPAPRRSPASPTYTPPRPSTTAVGSDYGRGSDAVGGRAEPLQGPSYAAAVARAYERPSSVAPAAVENRRPEPAGGIALVTEAPQAEPVAAPSVPEPPVRVSAPPAQPTSARSYPAVEKPKQGGNGAATAKEVRAAAAATPKPQAPVVVTPAERPKPQPAAKPAEKAAEKPTDKKAKDRKQQQQQQQQQKAAAEAAAAEAARAKAAEQAAKSAKAARFVDEDFEETWSTKWAELRENSSEALEERGWQKYAFAPESLAVVALLLCLVIGLPVWLMRKKPANATPAPVAQNVAPAQTSASPAPAPATSASSVAPAAPNGKPADAQAKPTEQNTVKTPDQTQQQQPQQPTPAAQVISPAPEAPRNVAKNVESSAAEPPPLVGAAPGASGGLGNIVKDVPVSVPKLAGQKLRVSSGVAQGQLVHQVTPQYPSQARQERVQGTVVLQAVIAKDGSVAKLSVVSGPSQLTKSAMEAVKQWRYRPFALNGEPVEADTQINVNFKLGE